AVRDQRLYECDSDRTGNLARHRAGNARRRSAPLECQRCRRVQASADARPVRVLARQLQLHGIEPWRLAGLRSGLQPPVVRSRGSQFRRHASRLGVRSVCHELIQRTEDHSDPRPRQSAGRIHASSQNHRRVGLRKVLSAHAGQQPGRGMTPPYSAWSLLRARFARGGYWRPLWSGRPLQDAYDIVVVGAGGHGLATAYHLARDHGARRIAVLEKRLVGYGNVGRNTTIVRSNYLLPENHYFYEDSLRRWEGLSRELNYNVMYSPRGVLDLATSDGDMIALARRGNAMRLAGIDAELLDRSGIARFAPELNPEQPRRFAPVGGLLQRRGGTVRHDAVAWGYARAAAALGVDIIEDCDVTGVSTAGGVAVGVETSRGYVKAGRIVFAVAGHTGAIGTMLGLSLPVETHLLQAMVTEPVKPLVSTVLVYAYPHGEVY